LIYSLDSVRSLRCRHRRTGKAWADVVMTSEICSPNRVKRVSLWVWRQERQARQALRRCRRDRREVIATSRAQKAPSQRGHRHWAKDITFGSGARARTRKFAVGMEDVVLKRDSQKRHSVRLGVGSGELCVLGGLPKASDSSA